MSRLLCLDTIEIRKGDTTNERTEALRLLRRTVRAARSQGPFLLPGLQQQLVASRARESARVLSETARRGDPRMSGNDHQSNATRDYAEPDASQAERRAILKSDRDAREAHRSYHAMAVGDPDVEGGPAVVGAAPVYGAGLVGPAWSRDLASLPKERPLGQRVDDLPDMEACWWEPDAIGPRGGSTDE
jgi:hypothetical protein